MTVKDIMTTKVTAVGLTTPVLEVTELLHKNHYTGVPVVDEKNQVLGVITERELFSADYNVYIPFFAGMMKDSAFSHDDRKLLPYVVQQLSRVKAQDIMNKQVFFARPDMSLDVLLVQMSARGTNPVPVTDSNNQLLGIVSRSDLLKNFSHTSVNNNPPLSHRPVDDQIGYTRRDLSSKFVFIARFKANIWLTTAVLLFVFGFILGIAYVVDPSFVTDRFAKPEAQTPQQIQIRNVPLPD